MAEAARARYPDGGVTHILVSTMLWRKGDFEGAARNLAASKRFFTARDWISEAVPAFADVFAADPDAAGRALDALVKAVPDAGLIELAEQMDVRGNSDLAMRLLQRLESVGGLGMRVVMEEYELLRRLKGSEAALQRVRRAFPSPELRLAVGIYQYRHYDLLWDLFPRPPNEPQWSLLLTMRAAALAQQDVKSGARYDELVQMLNAKPRDDVYALYAKYFANLVDKDEVLRAAKKDLASAAWTLGIRAGSEKRFLEASDWFQVAVSAGPSNYPPAGWSWEILAVWRASGRFLPQAAIDRPFTLPLNPMSRR